MVWSTLEDFKNWGLPEAANWSGTIETIYPNLSAAQATIETALRTAGHDLPIPETSITDEIRQKQCIIAGYEHLRVRGWETKSDADSEFVKGYERALKWLKDVRNGLQVLPKNPVTQETQDASPTEEGRGAAVVSDPWRGWGRTWP